LVSPQHVEYARERILDHGMLFQTFTQRDSFGREVLSGFLKFLSLSFTYEVFEAFEDFFVRPVGSSLLE